MKKIYFALVLTIGFFATASAQNEAISACTNGDTVSISFDLSLNCTNAPGSLSGLTALGFHSGANTWSSVIAWDDASAVTAVNDGSDVFTAQLEPISYYGLATSPDNIYFVFNQGPVDPNNPWASEGKGDDGAGNCIDFFVEMANLTPCSTTSTNEISFEGSMTIAPNPMGNRTALLLDNPNNEVFNLTITNLTGQVIRTINGIRENVVEIERGDLTSGVYFVTLQGENGGRITEKLVVR